MESQRPFCRLARRMAGILGDVLVSIRMKETAFSSAQLILNTNVEVDIAHPLNYKIMVGI